MIVGIDYSTDGSRHISFISFISRRSIKETKSFAERYSAFCDEIYIIDIDNTCEDFINEVVTKGCRIM